MPEQEEKVILSRVLQGTADQLSVVAKEVAKFDDEVERWLSNNWRVDFDFVEAPVGYVVVINVIPIPPITMTFNQVNQSIFNLRKALGKRPEIVSQDRNMSVFVLTADFTPFNLPLLVNFNIPTKEIANALDMLIYPDKDARNGF